MNRQKSRRVYSKAKKHYELIQHNLRFIQFSQTGGYRFYWVPVDYKPGDIGAYPGT